MKDNYSKMLETKVSKLLLALSIPTIISMLISSIYNIADTYFVSQINESASAAVSVVFSLQTFIQAIGFTIGMGCGSLLSIALGNKDKNKASKIASSGVSLGLFLGIILLVFSLIFHTPFMKLLGASKTSLPYALDYSLFIIIGAPFMILSFILNNILRSEGKARLSMIGIGLGSIINIGLDPLFIYGLDMGAKGAGLATMISQMISFSILLSFFILKKSDCILSPKNVTFSLKKYGIILKTGSPTLFRQGCATIANIALNSLAKPYGDAVVAALGITAKIYIFCRNIIIGIGQGYQPILGFSYGAKKPDRIKDAFKVTLIAQSVVCIISVIVVLCFANPIVSVFRDNDEVISVGSRAVRLLAIGLPLLGFSTIVNQSLQVTKHTKSATFLASLRQGIIYIPLIFLFEYLFNDLGLALTQPISDLLTALISIPFCIYFFKEMNKLKTNEEQS